MDTKELTAARMAALGVESADIFTEIMRARYLDYVIFSDPKNEEYGLSQADMYREAVRLTGESIGTVPGNEESYAYIYTVAMSVDPMLFSGAAPAGEAMQAVLSHAAEAAAKGKKVLFAGAENYLTLLTPVFVALKGRDITVTVPDAAWQEKLGRIYARGRIALASDVAGEDSRYDYIFLAAGNGPEAGAFWAAARRQLAEGGVMEALIPDGLLAEEESAAEERRAESRDFRISSLYHVVDGEQEAELVSYGASEPDGQITIGELGFEGGTYSAFEKFSMPRKAFAEADSWEYDLYAYNGSPALQTILGAGILDPDYAVAMGYKPVYALRGTSGTYPWIRPAAVTEAGIRLDKVVEKELSDIKRVQPGDLLITVRKGEVCCAVVPALLKEAAAGDGIFVLRPFGSYTVEYLKAYLEGPLGSLFLKTMRAGSVYHLSTSRLLRVPLKEAKDDSVIQAITERVRETTGVLMAAEEDWRQLKLEAVNLMMGKFGE